MGIEDRIQAAERAKEAATAELYRGDGTHFLSDEEHAERERRIGAEFRAGMDRIEAGIEERIANTERELLVAEGSEPSSGLSTEELQRAAATGGTLLDWCPVGLILLIGGARTILGWERICVIELQED